MISRRALGCLITVAVVAFLLQVAVIACAARWALEVVK